MLQVRSVNRAAPSMPPISDQQAAVLAQIESLDPDAMNPRQALELVYQLHGLLAGAKDAP